MPEPPHPANVPGDFYVENGCCTLCAVPFSKAPDLFAYWPNAQSPEHCYVKRQPQNAGELEQMVMVIRSAELQCIHYRGTDRQLQTRLVKIGEGGACDILPADLRKQAGIEEEGDEQFLTKQVGGGSWFQRIRAWWRGGA